MDRKLKVLRRKFKPLRREEPRRPAHSTSGSLFEFIQENFISSETTERDGVILTYIEFAIPNPRPMGVIKF